MRLEDLVLVSTHRCNMSCDHCLRGWAENQDMHFDIALDAIRTLKPRKLTITGGEPTLRMDLLEEVYQLFRMTPEEYRFGLFIATNGKMSVRKTIRFMEIMVHMARLCDGDNNSIALRVSRDEYHTHHDWAYNKIRQIVDEFDDEYKLSLEHYKPFGDFRGVINTGKAEEFSLGRRDVESVDPEITWCREWDGEISVLGPITIDTDGSVISGCNRSYDDMRKLKLCHYSEFTEEYVMNTFEEEL